MKLGIIVRNITEGGVKRLLFDLLSELQLIPGCKYYIFTNEKISHVSFPGIEIVFVPGRNRLTWDYWTSFFVIRKFSLDALIYPKNIIPLSHFFLQVKKFNIVCDLAHFDKTIKAYRFFDALYMRLLMSLSCRFAVITFAISQSTKNDLVNIIGIPDEKIAVLHGAVSKNFDRSESKQEHLNKYNVKKPYFFYCGSISPRKNLLRTLEAFYRLKDVIPHNFYISTGKSWSDSEVRTFIETKLRDRVFILPFVPDEELVSLYSNAELFLYPSLYEGFGLPILEAQSCGCPVLTSNTTSCAEVAGKGAVLVNPTSISQIVAGILSVVNSEARRKELIEAGFENLKRFSWRQSAKSLFSIIREHV